MLEALASSLEKRRFDEAASRIAELRECGADAYRDAPASADEDFVAAEECLLALGRGDPVAAHYRIVDGRRGIVGDVTTLCMDAVARALSDADELLLAAAAWAAVPTGDFDAELEAVLLELRIDRFALDEKVAERGVQHWQRALEARPDDALGFTCLALHARTAGDDELAASAAKRAIELDPAAAEAHLLLADLLADAGDEAGARRALERGSAESGDPELWTALGEALERAGELERAREAFERALEPDLDHGGALEGRRRVLAELGDHAALVEHLARMIELASDLDQAELLMRERHRICIEELGLGDRVLEERRQATRQRRRALAEYDQQLAEGLAKAPPEPARPAAGSPLWVLGGIVLALALLGVIAAFAEL